MNILKINGTAISGIYVDAAVSFNKPAKRVQSISVPGRNGNLIIDEGAFDNVLISYPVYEKATFPAEFDQLVNWLASLEGYQRIECSNDPQHFRLGRFVVPTSPTAKRLNRDGYYQLSFDCKPQRYLNLGEVPTEIDANPSETYGPADIVSFEAAQEDTISGAEFSIVPVQDLHGYDSPWPAGGGKNLFGGADGTFSNGSVREVVVANGVMSYMVNTSATSAYFLVEGIITSSMVANKTLKAGTYIFSIATNAISEANLATLRLNLSDGTAVSPNSSFTLSADADIVSITSTATIQYSTGTYTLQIQIESGSTATAWTPYSNICPISGFTGAEITDRGVNLWDEEWEYRNGNGWSKNFIPISPNTNYWVKAPYNVGVISYRSDKTSIGATVYTSPSNGLITTPNNAAYLKFFIASAYGSTYNHDISINYPSTDTAYHASVGATKDITWQDEAGTVYGGTLEYLGGDAWRLTKTMESVDLGDLAWIHRDDIGAGLFAATLAGYKKTDGVSALSSGYDFAGGVGSASAALAKGNGTCSLYTGVGVDYVVYAVNTAYSDAAIFTTAVTGQQLVYELATPVTYDLTGEELARIVGQNNIFANCGQSTVVITEPTYFVNPGYFTSKPIIRVYGDGTFRVGDNIITIAAHTQPYIDIDSELQDCYYEDTNMNSYVTFSTGEYPVLVPGQNYILMGSGITKLIITPRWWEL